MKELLWRVFGGIVTIVLLIVTLEYIIPGICNFVNWLFKVKYIDWGFSNWIEVVIDVLSGVITYFIVKTIFYACSKRDKKTIEEIVSIIVGFVISVIVYFLIKFWLIILIISVISLIVLIICRIIIARKRNKKVETKDVVLQHRSSNE